MVNVTEEDRSFIRTKDTTRTVYLLDEMIRCVRANVNPFYMLQFVVLTIKHNSHGIDDHFYKSLQTFLIHLPLENLKLVSNLVP